MLLKLPFWRYPAVILFSVLIHGIFVLMLINQPQRDNLPTEIRWFEFTELELPRPVPEAVPALLVKPVSQALDSPEVLHKSWKANLPESETFEFAVPKPEKFPNLLLETKEESVDQKTSSDAETGETVQTHASGKPGIIDPPQTVMQPKSPQFSLEKNDDGLKEDTVPEKVPGKSISFNKVLEDTRRFQNLTLWNGDKAQHSLSPSMGALLTGIKMISINNDSAEAEKNLRLDSGEAQSYRSELNTFFSERWEVPLYLAESELTVVIRIRIDKDGRIQKSEIEKPSGNSELDHSVEKLLKSLQSLPSLPYSYLGHSYEFGIRFTPRDFQF